MRFFVFLWVAASCATAHGQFGYARSGVYPSDYKMQTFTGKLLDYKPETHEITLKCDICAEDEQFVAIVGDPEISTKAKMMVAPHDLKKSRVEAYVRKAAPDEIVEGDLLRAYFNERNVKRDGKKVKYNAVFAMEKLAPAAPTTNLETR